jgi:hypothetical protein
MQILILVKKHVNKGTKAFLKGSEPGLFAHFLSIFMLLALDPHFLYGFEYRTVKQMRIHAGPDPDPKHWFLLCA